MRRDFQWYFGLRDPGSSNMKKFFNNFVFILYMSNFFIISAKGSENESQIQAPRIITQPSSAGSGLVSEGRTKILQCQALGIPQPEYRWLKDGEFLGDFSSEHFYKITSSTRNDSGFYQCIVRNDAGAIFSDKIKVTVAYMSPFEETSGEKRVVVRSGEAAILEFPKIQSYPPPSVSWQASDNSLLFGSKFALTSDFRQIILDVNSADEKGYRARATNTQVGIEEISAFTSLIISSSSPPPSSLPPSIIVPPSPSSLLRGTPEAELECIANGRPLRDLETLWLKDGVGIESAGVAHSFNDLYNRTLSLLRVERGHGGEYTCMARLRGYSYPAQTATARINIIERPSFTTPLPPETFGEFGREVRLSCPVAGVPLPTITWYKDTIPATGLPFINIDNESGVLSVPYLRAEDGGMYQCVAKNEGGEASSHTWLRVKTPGSKIGNPSSKIYKLTFSDLFNSRNNASAPVMIKGPENKTALEGNDVTLHCEVGGAPVPNITWYKNETDEIVNGGRFQVLESGSLLITSPRSRDSGLYTCIRSNGGGTVVGSATVLILIRTQIVTPPADTQTILGQVATLQCKVASHPGLAYDIEWEHENEPIIPGVSSRILIHLDGTLEIREVRADDVGSYKCIVKSQGGHDERTGVLKIIELPYPPTNVVAQKMPKLAPGANSKAVNLTWASGFDGNSVILKYIVQKRTVTPDSGKSNSGESTEFVPGPWETLLTNISADLRSIIIEGLKPSASYQFRVSSVNSVGEGESSVGSNVVTLPQEPPSGPPVGLVGSARSPSQIIIQWHPPSDEHKNGAILGYIIRYRLHGYGDGSPWSVRNITNEELEKVKVKTSEIFLCSASMLDAQRNYLISDLITWKDYEIQIGAYNNKGIGTFSQGIKIKTREGVPNAAPTQIKAISINSTCIQATWLPPDPQQINGINQGYKIQAFSDGLLAHTVSLPPSPTDPLAQQSGLICGLEKYKDYNISVLCFTNPGDGKRSPFVQCRTMEDTPGEVGGFRFEEITDRAVRVVWEAPSKPNGILTGYLLRYGIKDSLSSFLNINLTSNLTNIKLTALRANTYYHFEICPTTKAGKGICSSASIKSGVEPVLPSPPFNLALSNIQPFSVVVQFTPGFDGNSSISKWRVEGVTDRNSTWVLIYEHFEEEETFGSSSVGSTTPSPHSPTPMCSITVFNLAPFTQYKLRLLAHNVVGASSPSEPTQMFQTLQAPPANGPRNVTVRAISATSLKVRWIPLQQNEWYGNPKGYNISYRSLTPLSHYDYQIIENPTGNTHVISNLEEYTLYEIYMAAINDVGISDQSNPSIERTREAVPGQGPNIIESNATSSTTIVVHWGSVPERHANGIIEGYKVYYGAKNVEFQYKNIMSNSTYKTTLTQLKKFTRYHIQVLAFTRVGDGVLCEPPVQVQTWDDVPGVVSNISFPDVSTSMARMIWDAPKDPNGVILAYKITYALEGFTSPSFAMEFPPETRTFRATDLEAEKNYLFTISARTRLGWGESSSLLVYTAPMRELPSPPSAPFVSPSQTHSSSLTLSWTAGRDGWAPIRYYELELCEGGGHWERVSERVGVGGGGSYTVGGLKAYKEYRFRIRAVNDLGRSEWSGESNATWTLPAAPSGRVGDVTVVPITPTSVRVSWKPLSNIHWNGDESTGGYRVSYRQVVDSPSPSPQPPPSEEIKGIGQSTLVLSDLSRDRNYEISVTPFNSRGGGSSSAPLTVYVGEAVPTGEPREVSIVSGGGSEIRIKWKGPLDTQTNGELLGYKIYYKAENSEEEDLEVVPSGTSSHSLFYLENYTWYTVRIAAFNPAGDGPSSPPYRVRTLQGPPGEVGAIFFHDITMTSLKIGWGRPEKPNGEIGSYLVTYETVLGGGSGSGEDQVISKQVRQKVSCCSLLVENLEEETSYSFSVRAKNSFLNEVGPPVWKNVSTGPQSGSPPSPTYLELTKMYGAVLFKWRNEDKGTIVGYYIEAKRRVTEDWEMHENRWQTIIRTDNGPLTEFTLSYQNLLPSSAYNFRLIAYNQHGISYPVPSDVTVHTPSKLYLEYGYTQPSPFYRQTWFLVVVASLSVILIIALVAFLFVKTKSYKYKHESERSLAESGSLDDDALGGGGVYGSSVELREADRKHSSLSSTARRKSRKNGSTSGTLTLNRAPPRPTPGSVTYTDDESDKAYSAHPNPDDESSLTEKPSEISSTDSQGSETEVEDEVDAPGAPPPHSFVSHYANVNDTLKQSWAKQRPVRSALPIAYSSYTDSEPEATTSLQGGAQGRIVLNNMARSRAPLPGFSSFI